MFLLLFKITIVKRKPSSSLPLCLRLRCLEAHVGMGSRVQGVKGEGTQQGWQREPAHLCPIQQEPGRKYCPSECFCPWPKCRGPSNSCLAHSADVGCLEKGVTSGEVALYSWGEPWRSRRGGQLGSCWLFPRVEQQVLSGRGSGRASLSLPPYSYYRIP